MSHDVRPVSIRAREIYNAALGKSGAVQEAISEPIKAAQSRHALERLRSGMERRGLLIPT